MISSSNDATPTAPTPRGLQFNDERRMMKKRSILAVAALTGAAAVMLAGCSGSGSPSSTGTGAAGGKRACVILPDAASSPRWENFDRKYLQEGLTAAGFQADIQNAQGDTNKYSTIADQQM